MTGKSRCLSGSGENHCLETGGSADLVGKGQTLSVQVASFCALNSLIQLRRFWALS